MSEAYMRKQAMYCMVLSIEEDFIQNFKCKLDITDIDPIHIQRARKNGFYSESFEAFLRALDLQSFIEISCKNVLKLGVSKNDKDFLNNEFKEIIAIRNRVMHPRILEFYDFTKLQECFNTLKDTLKFIEWKNVETTKNLLENHPEKLPLPKFGLVKRQGVIDNIPEITDFEETSFIGRQSEINELKQLLFKKNVHILSIIGDGGVGKTAITLKLLYDILDEAISPFEVIIWVSLKTRSLQKFEFSDIDGSIKSISEMYEDLRPFISTNSPVDTSIIDISKSFKTLFVLDNLETIDIKDVKDFLFTLSEEAKVIITSRIGLGEMEIRYRLNGLNDVDVIEYFNILLSLYGYEGRFTNHEKASFAVNELHSNPLAIKWFVRGLSQGYSPNDLLKMKGDVISFCMSNVFEKLNAMSKRILEIALILGDEFSYAELLFYLNFSSNDDSKVRNSINELIKTNFLESQRFSASMISLSAFSREYLTKILGENGNIKERIEARLQKLNCFIQDMKTKVNTGSAFNISCFIIPSNCKEKAISAFYLHESLKCSRKDLTKSTELVELAELLTPEYFETSKVRGFLYSATNPTKALEAFRVAVNKATSIDEQIVSQVIYSRFLMKTSDYEHAITILEKVINDLSPSASFDITGAKLELSKAYTCCGLFPLAQAIIDEIDYDNLSSISYKNSLLTRRAEISLRKFDSMEGQGQYDNRFLLMDALEILKTSENPDMELIECETTLLLRLSNYLYDDTVCDYIIQILGLRHNIIYNAKAYKKFSSIVLSKLHQINSPTKREFLHSFIKAESVSVDQLEENQGVICSIVYNKGYGFFKTKEYPNGIYFKLQSDQPCSIGSIINHSEIIQNPGKAPWVESYTVLENLTIVQVDEF